MDSEGAQRSCYNISWGTGDIFVKLIQYCKVIWKKEIDSDSLASEIFCKKLETTGFIVAVLKTILLQISEKF